MKKINGANVQLTTFIVTSLSRFSVQLAVSFSNMKGRTITIAAKDLIYHLPRVLKKIIYIYTFKKRIIYNARA